MDRSVCYFDGRCGMCRRSTNTLRHLDWLNRLEFADMTRMEEAELPVPLDTAMRGMPMRTRAGVVLVGFEAVRHALLQTPLGVVPALVMFIPGISHAGRRVYNFIAAHRRRDIACAVT